jgi:hypothetical protein
MSTSKTLIRSTQGTFIPKYGKAMKTIGVRVPAEVADKLDLLPNKTEYLRQLLIEVAEKMDQQIN